MKYLESQGLWRAASVGLLISLALIAFWPSPVDAPVQGELAGVLRFFHAHGMPTWFDYNFVEASANVLLFVPLGMVSALASPKRHWWQIGVFGMTVSSCMELGQLFFVHGRFASYLDLVTNIGGAVIGALWAGVILDRLRSATYQRRTNSCTTAVTGHSPQGPQPRLQVSTEPTTLGGRVVTD